MGVKLEGRKRHLWEAALRPVEALSKNGCVLAPPRWLLALSGFGEECSEVPPALSSPLEGCAELSCYYLGHIPIWAALSLRSFSPASFSMCARVPVHSGLFLSL